MLRFRCASQSQPGLFYLVSCDEDGCRCECGASEGWCSHIDATIVHRERFMVPEEDHANADLASDRLGVLLVAPTNWQAAWKRRTVWRGLAQPRRFTPSLIGKTGQPVVCFTGDMPKLRKEYEAEAISAGWQVSPKFHTKIDVLVAADPLGNSRKLKEARERDVLVLCLEEWEMARVDGLLPR